MSIGNYITIAIFTVGLIITYFSAKTARQTSKTTKQMKLQAKVDRVDHEKQIETVIQPLEDRVKSLEDSHIEFRYQYKYDQQETKNQLGIIISENKRQSKAMDEHNKLQATVTAELLKELKEINISLSNKQDR